GIIWLRAPSIHGSSPSILSILERTTRALGDDQKFADEDDALAALRRLLDKRRCLIVLDDPVDRHLIIALRYSLSAGARLLFTTPQTDIAGAVGAKVHFLGTLSRTESLLLLARWNGRGAGLPAEAETIAKLLGDLPLALAMAGAAMRDRPPASWRE